MNTTIFSLVHALFLRGCRSPSPTGLSDLRWVAGARARSTPVFRPAVLALSRWPERVFGHRGGQRARVTLTGLGEAAQLSALAVTSNYFDVGAQTLDVLRVVIAQGMKPVLIGLVAGMAAALALGRLLAAQLYEISPHNPLLLATTGAILGVAALLACVLPARKASLLNPVQALRTD